MLQVSRDAPDSGTSQLQEAGSWGQVRHDLNKGFFPDMAKSQTPEALLYVVPRQSGLSVLAGTAGICTRLHTAWSTVCHFPFVSRAFPGSIHGKELSTRAVTSVFVILG